MSKKILLKSQINKDEYTDYVCQAFDIQNKDETLVEIPFNFDSLNDEPWNIGLIYGGSGSGKSTILKNLGEISKPTFDPDKSLISNFSMLSPNEATKVLNAIGLSSVPSWLRPFHTLSNGEQFRAEVAMAIAMAKDGDVILIDEFTSVVDRDVAKTMSFALQKYIRKTNKKIVLASCHYDIFEWLNPDWSYSPLNTGGVIVRHDWRRQSRPQIELTISRVEYEAWDFFKKHHYMTEDVNRSFQFYLYEWNNKPVAMCVVKPQPRKGCSNAFGLSRTVVLPDYQGIGLGVFLSEHTLGMVKANGGLGYTKTINPALGEKRNNSPNWRGTPSNGKGRTEASSDDARYRNRQLRVSYCHEYVGPAVDGFQDIMLPIAEMRKLKIAREKAEKVVQNPTSPKEKKKYTGTLDFLIARK